jgi:hypothetical protein
MIDMPKIIKYITELKFRRGESGNGVLYNVLGKDDLEWEDADEVIITIDHTKQRNIPALLNTIISIREKDTVFVPVEPMACEVDAKEDKILMKCEI